MSCTRWKLIEFLEDGRVELYDLGADPGEVENLAGGRPEKMAELLGELRACREAVNARMPAANPDFDPERADLWPAGNGTRERTPLGSY